MNLKNVASDLLKTATELAKNHQVTVLEALKACEMAISMQAMGYLEDITNEVAPKQIKIKKP